MGDRAAEHYDRVTAAWQRLVMGDELHFGLFESPADDLETATRNLTHALARAAELAPGHAVLDVGCGTGAPACALAESYGVAVTGISTSAIGVELATARAAARGLTERARFLVADAVRPGLPAASLDRVFSLESTHLMPERERLFAEWHRLLRPGGRLALCDVVMIGSEADEVASYVLLGHSAGVAARMRGAVHETLHRAFGSSALPRGAEYVELARAAGFTEVVLTDLSRATRRTLERWAKNAVEHEAALTAELGADYVRELFLALLHMSFGWGRLGGYVQLTAVRPGS